MERSSEGSLHREGEASVVPEESLFTGLAPVLLQQRSPLRRRTEDRELVQEIAPTEGEQSESDGRNKGAVDVRPLM